MLSTPEAWKQLPAPVTEWLGFQDMRSILPEPDELLIETFPRANKFYLVCYPFDGRLAHQSLGMLLTRRLDRMGAKPLGFVASEYALALWGLEDFSRMTFDDLFDEDMMGDDLDAWLAESNLLKRTFRNCAIIAGLIERRYPGQEKQGDRSPSRPISFTMCCEIMNPTTFYCARRKRMRPPACWTLRVWVICSNASRDIL